MTPPAASVIVPSYRGAERLPALLTALAAQDRTDFEVIVVVDGRVDGSAALLESWIGPFELRPIVFDANRGRVAALNAGFEAARGGVLIRCDDDLLPPPGHIGGHLRAHAGRTAGVVAPPVDVHADTPYARAYGTPASRRMRAHFRSLDPQDAWRLWSADASVTAETYARIGPYDERFRHYGWEDIDWGRRLMEAGIPVVVEPTLEVPHLAPAPTLTARAAKAYSSGASRRLFESIHGPDALPPVDSGARDPWNRAVRALANGLTEARLHALTTAVDRILGALPRPVGEKACALLIEAGGRAGYANAAEAPSTEVPAAEVPATKAHTADAPTAAGAPTTAADPRRTASHIVARPAAVLSTGGTTSASARTTASRTAPPPAPAQTASRTAPPPATPPRDAQPATPPAPTSTEPPVQ